jgi:hypothetical protein
VQRQSDQRGDEESSQPGAVGRALQCSLDVTSVIKDKSKRMNKKSTYVYRSVMKESQLAAHGMMGEYICLDQTMSFFFTHTWHAFGSFEVWDP